MARATKNCQNGSGNLVSWLKDTGVVVMAKRGPKPKPTALRILEGNPGRRPLNTNEPQPPGGMPDPPEHIQGRALDMWHTLAPQLAACGMVTAVDAHALELLVDCYAKYCEMTAEASRTGPVLMDPDNPLKFKISPYWSQAQVLAQRLYVLLREFGMTPSARSTMHVSGPATEPAAPDPAAQYFRATTG